MKTVTCDYCEKPIEASDQNIELHISCTIYPENNKRLDLHRGKCFNTFMRQLNNITNPEHRQAQKNAA